MAATATDNKLRQQCGAHPHTNCGQSIDVSAYKDPKTGELKPALPYPYICLLDWLAGWRYMGDDYQVKLVCKPDGGLRL